MCPLACRLCNCGPSGATYSANTGAGPSARRRAAHWQRQGGCWPGLPPLQLGPLPGTLAFGPERAALQAGSPATLQACTCRSCPSPCRWRPCLASSAREQRACRRRRPRHRGSDQDRSQRCRQLSRSQLEATECTQAPVAYVTSACTSFPLRRGHASPPMGSPVGFPALFPLSVDHHPHCTKLLTSRNFWQGSQLPALVEKSLTGSEGDCTSTQKMWPLVRPVLEPKQLSVHNTCLWASLGTPEFVSPPFIHPSDLHRKLDGKLLLTAAAVVAGCGLPRCAGRTGQFPFLTYECPILNCTELIISFVQLLSSDPTTS